MTKETLTKAEINARLKKEKAIADIVVAVAFAMEKSTSATVSFFSEDMVSLPTFFAGREDTYGWVARLVSAVRVYDIGWRLRYLISVERDGVEVTTKAGSLGDAFIGQWPGDETDEEVEKALEELS